MQITQISKKIDFTQILDDGEDILQITIEVLEDHHIIETVQQILGLKNPVFSIETDITDHFMETIILMIMKILNILDKIMLIIILIDKVDADTIHIMLQDIYIRRNELTSLNNNE